MNEVSGAGDLIHCGDDLVQRRVQCDTKLVITTRCNTHLQFRKEKCAWDARCELAQTTIVTLLRDVQHEVDGLRTALNAQQNDDVRENLSGFAGSCRVWHALMMPCISWSKQL